MHSNNGNETTSGSDLLAMRETVHAPGPGSAMQDAPAASVTYPARPDLAEETRQRRAGRRFRALVIGADYRMKDRVRHPDGGESSVGDIIADEKAQRAQIQEEMASGSRKHQRMPRWIHRIPWYVLCFDFMLLLYFFGGITNVNWASPLSIALGFAIVLAAMVTVLCYGFLAFTGHRLRGHKNHLGTVHREEVDGVTRLACGVAVAIIAVIGTLMYLRMRSEVVYALGVRAGVTALVIAVSLALVNAAANFLVIAVHAVDGSDQVARLDKLSAAARRPYARAQRMREEAAHHAEADH